MVRPLVTTSPRGELIFTDALAPIGVDLSEIKSADGDDVRVRVHLGVRIPSSDADRRVLRQTLLGGRAVLMPADVAEALAPRLLQAARSLGLMSEQWSPPSPDTLAVFQRAAATATYVIGLELDSAPVRIEVEIPSYHLRLSEQRRQQARDSQEQRRLESARRVADVLKDLRDRSVAFSEVLRELPADEAQSLLVSALGQATAAPGKVVCVAGNALVHLSPSGSRWDTHIRALPADLGPLRSVFASGLPGEMLIGARDGILRVEGDTITPYRDHALACEHGFSVVVRSGDRLYAAHRQRGLVWWNESQPDEPAGCRRSPPGTPPAPPSTATALPTLSPNPPAAYGHYTALLPWSEQRVLAASTTLEMLQPDGSLTPLASLPARTLLLTEAEGLVVAVGDDGVLRLFDTVDLRPAGEIRLGEPLVSSAVLPFPGGVRVLCASAGGAVISCGLTDPVVLRYASAHRGMREVAGGPGMVAAVSPDRMRAVLWDAWEPRRPATEVHVGAVARGRIADLTIL